MVQTRKAVKPALALLLSAILTICLSVSAVLSFAASDDVVPAGISKKDGRYTVKLTVNGGAVEASVASPVFLRVENGVGYATIEWENVKYDTMIVDGETFTPIDDSNNSTFEIPVTAYDQIMKVTAVADGEETDYGFTFASGGIHKVRTVKDYLLVVLLFLAVFGIALFFSIRKLMSPDAKAPVIPEAGEKTTRPEDPEVPEETSSDE